VHDLNDVCWIGGPAGAGKTTVARRLARRYGARLYSADSRTWVHRARAEAAGDNAAIEWQRRRPTQDWDDVTDEELVAMSLHVMRGPMVREDVEALPPRPLVIAEGTTLPAASVGPNALWLLPYEPPSPDRLTSALTAVIVEEARANNLPTLVVSPSIEETVARVEAHFTNQLASASLAHARDDRAALLREYNQSIVDQVRGYYANDWATGDPDAVTQSFVCECARRDCIEEVVVPLSVAWRGPVTSPGHA
jgi:hypothetical protein